MFIGKGLRKIKFLTYSQKSPLKNYRTLNLRCHPLDKANNSFKFLKGNKSFKAQKEVYRINQCKVLKAVKEILIDKVIKMNNNSKEVLIYLLPR